MRPVRRLLIAVVVASSLVAAAPADATTKAIWGPTHMPDGRSAFPTYRHLGVDVLQTTLLWYDVAEARPERPRNPRDPAYQWPERVDVAIRAGRRSDITVALMVVGTPAWANGGKEWNWAPDRPRDFKNFVVAAARRYPQVRRWMIWGEPDRQENFQPLPRDNPTGPRLYAKLLDGSYEALKHANRRNIVVGGNIFSNGDVFPSDYVRFMRLPNGKPPRLDEFGFNPFSTRFPDIDEDPYHPEVRDICDVDTFADEVHNQYKDLKRFRKRGPKLWLSEWTISSDHGNYDFGWYVTREEQAQWLTAAYKIARRARYISGLGWIGLLDDPKETENGLTTGLMTWEGEKKPAYRAYRRVP